MNMYYCILIFSNNNVLIFRIHVIYYICHNRLIYYMCAKSLQSCLTLRDPIDYSQPGSSVHGILQARVLEWGAMPSSSNLPDPGIELVSPAAPELQADSLLLSQLGSPLCYMLNI